MEYARLVLREMWISISAPWFSLEVGRRGMGPAGRRIGWLKAGAVGTFSFGVGICAGIAVVCTGYMLQSKSKTARNSACHHFLHKVQKKNVCRATLFPCFDRGKIVTAKDDALLVKGGHHIAHGIKIGTVSIYSVETLDCF